jgi:hypothetical protein
MRLANDTPGRRRRPSSRTAGSTQGCATGGVGCDRAAAGHRKAGRLPRRPVLPQHPHDTSDRFPRTSTSPRSALPTVGSDLAVSTSGTGWNYGPGWEDTLLEAYGTDSDPDTLATTDDSGTHLTAREHGRREHRSAGGDLATRRKAGGGRPVPRGASPESQRARASPESAGRFEAPSPSRPTPDRRDSALPDREPPHRRSAMQVGSKMVSLAKGYSRRSWAAFRLGSTRYWSAVLSCP